ncbi:MAG: methylated-DNA--[protein]-cysteine S-methyltransferase [Rhodoblastus sp.]
MDGYGSTYFDTPIGFCGLAWSPRGVKAFQLPEETPEATRARLTRRAGAPFERKPPAEIAEIVMRIGKLLAGRAVDLSDIALDMDRVGAFEAQVYVTARCIPCGETRTYGQIARAIGEPGAARGVGQALGRNPFAIIVPCHRVVAANGRTGGFSAGGGVNTKLRILEIERRAVGLSAGAADGQLRLL